ncbi:transcriptional regulator, partial [Streptomyces sp. ventii]|nr:transcriptional regulator [Streptomyces spiramenti]
MRPARHPAPELRPSRPRSRRAGSRRSLRAALALAAGTAIAALSLTAGPAAAAQG